MYTFVDNNYKRIRVIYGTLSGVATLYLFRNGVEHRVISSDISSEPIFDIEDNETYELYIKTETPQTVYLTVVCSSGVKYNKEDTFGGSFGQVVEYVQDSPPISIVTTSDVNVNQVAPKLKLIDFLKGVLTMFNGTLSIDGDSIIMQTLESWYLVGDKLNLTPYINTDSIEIIRPKLPKIVNFKKEESKSATNTAYTDLTGQKYGELTAQFPYDGSDVTYQLPFETPIPVRLSTDVMAMFLIDKESKPYTPKAMNFSEMRKWVGANSDLDTNAIFRELYERASELLEPNCIPQIVLTLAEYSFKLTHSVDVEIVTAAALTEIMSNSVWK
jgi:hypothetical protein